MIEGDVALIDEMAKWFHNQLADDADNDPAEEDGERVERLPLAA